MLFFQLVLHQFCGSVDVSLCMQFTMKCLIISIIDIGVVKFLGKLNQFVKTIISQNKYMSLMIVDVVNLVRFWGFVTPNFSISYRVMQSRGNSVFGHVVLDSFNKESRD